MNAVTPAAGAGLPSLASLKENLVHTASGIATGTGGGKPILRMLRTGKFVYGAQNIEVEAGSQWAINPYTIQKGFVAWTDRKGMKNEPLAERLVPISAAMPTDLPEVRDEQNNGKVCDWAETYKLDLVCVTGEDKGTEVVFNPTSYGGKAAVQELLNAVIKQIDALGDGGAEIVPLVELTSECYMHQTYGETFNPILEVKGWTTLEGTASVGDGLENDTPAEAEAEAEAAAPAEATQEPEQHVTTRRRRRS